MYRGQKQECSPFFNQGASLADPNFTVASRSQIILGLNGRTEITLANLRPQIGKTANGGIALFALAKYCLHGVGSKMVISGVGLSWIKKRPRELIEFVDSHCS